MSANVLDMAEYILERKKPVPAMKLQKLVYYCQAWSLVWEDRPMYKGRIEAWANGPVTVELYGAHRGEYLLDSVGGNSSRLLPSDTETIDAVLEHYGDRSSQWLSDLIHQESPWTDARGDLKRGERGSGETVLASMSIQLHDSAGSERDDGEITHASMAEYYGSL